MPFLPRLFADPPTGRAGLRAMRLLWGLGLLDLTLDASIAWAVDHFYFRPRLLTGFFNVTSDTAATVFYVAAALALVAGQMAVAAQLHRFQQIGRDEAEAGGATGELGAFFAHQRWRAFLRLLFLGEFLGMMGLVLFLATGSWRTLVFLSGAAVVFGLQGFPRRAWWPAG